MARSHHRGRKGKPYMGTLEELRLLVDYDANTGTMKVSGPYGTEGTVMRDGHRHMRLPASFGTMYRGHRKAEYYRADHIAWMLCVGHWPTGWIEHIGPFKDNQCIDDLIHCDENGVRWWYGKQHPSEPRKLVQVDSYVNSVSEGPVTYTVTMENGKVVHRPRVSEAFRSLLSPPPEDPYEVIPYHKGEFGKDWGYIPPEPEPEEEST